MYTQTIHITKLKYTMVFYNCQNKHSEDVSCTHDNARARKRKLPPVKFVNVSLHLQILIYPPKLPFWGNGQTCSCNKKVYFLFLEKCP